MDEDVFVIGRCGCCKEFVVNAAYCDECIEWQETLMEEWLP